MICNNCGTENESGFKFCVKCGSSLSGSPELNYEQVDMGNYHSEEEFSEDSAGFTMDSGTFVIRDSAPPQSSAHDLFTADELNESDEEFDFSIYDEPSIPELNSPASPAQPVGFQQQQPMPNVNPYANQPQMPQNPQMAQNPQMTQQQMVQPQMMYGQPQIIGYDPTGMPIYGQPQMMYSQPQIIGYDPTGMPIYGQPQMMYSQPQIIGYDQTGMPIYGQPQMMYNQPQIIGYDQNGMPVYGQPQFQMNPGGIPVQGGISPMPNQGVFPGAAEQNGMAGIARQSAMNSIPEMPKAEPQKKAEPEKDESSDFWAFFDGEKAEKHESSDDFFGKAHSEPEIPTDPFADLDNRHKKNKQKKSFMSDTPIVDGGLLEKNESDRINRLYMYQTDTASSDLTVGSGKRKHGEMAATAEVNADMLSEKLEVRSRVSMQYAGEADPDEIEAYIPEHRSALMAEADHAVEAIPKKVDPYESELDKIELPEYMKAKKTVRETNLEIPSLPEV